MGEMGATATGSRVVALLAGRPDLDEIVREALRRVDPGAEGTSGHSREPEEKAD